MQHPTFRWIRAHAPPLLLTLLAGAALAAGAARATAQDKRVALRDQRRDLVLSTEAGGYAVLDGNEFVCYVIAGDNCRQVFNGPLGQGGYWPAGSPDAYVFGSGLQIAGIVGPDGGPWAADTAGAFFYDPGGTQTSGTEITGVYDSTEPEDLAAWPADGLITAESPFRTADVGRSAISSQDTWVRYWDGDPNRLSGRDHPMGIRVTQRSLQWAYPAGNESIIYFVYDLENVTAEDEFQRLNEAQFFAGEDRLPNDGYSLSDVYVNASADMDVTSNAGQNLSTAILPFDLAISYHGGFNGPGFVYSPQLFYPPFFVEAPGIVGIKILRAPGESAGDSSRLAMFTDYGGSSVGFPSPRGVPQLWRYMAGEINPAEGDFPCNIPAEVAGATPQAGERSVCNTFQTSRDTRFMAASGPFSLAPGERRTLALAYVVAPTLATLPDGSPTGIVANASNDSANPPGIPSFHPGFPSARGCTDETATTCTDVDAANGVRPIERGAGWVSYDGPAPATALESPAQKLDQFSVETATHSLLDRALIAQTIFDAKFLRPMPPEAPEFYVLPGTNAVTIVWDPSPTEETGDPFNELASDPESPLYNPNYRQFDVQAYEVWRGVRADSLERVAVFTVADRPFVDVTCELVEPDEEIGNPAGRGFALGETCPADYSRTAIRVPFFNNGGAGGRPGRGVVRSTSGLAAVVDQTPLPDWSGFGGGGVPFVYRDEGLVNNFSYFYSVTAADLNSPASGPASQRSERIVKSVLPRRDAPNLGGGTLEAALVGDDGVPLDPNTPVPSIDPETGTFDGPFPPTNAVHLTFAPLVQRLLPRFTLTATIDSIVPVRSPGSARGTPTPECRDGGDPFDICLKHYVSVDRDGAKSAIVLDVYDPWWALFGESVPNKAKFVDAEVPFDADALDAFGIPTRSGRATAVGTYNEALNNGGVVEGPQNRRSANFGGTSFVRHGGSRWFSGTEETVPDPAKYVRVGHLDGVDTVWAPIAYTPESSLNPYPSFGPPDFEKQCFSRALGKLGRAADVRFSWRNGRVSVRDVVQHVDVPFSPATRSSYGFLTTDANGNGVIDWQDFNYILGANDLLRGVAGGECDPAGNPGGVPGWNPAGTFPSVELTDTPEIVPVSTQGLRLEGAAGLGATGHGFGLYVNGERYIFQVESLPPDGRVWTLRTYSGTVSSDRATFDADDPSGYLYWSDFTGSGTGQRPPVVAGLTMSWTVSRPGLATGPPDLAEIHTVPDPYFFLSDYDGGSRDKQLLFVNLPPRATVRIYSLGGILVDVVDHDDPTGGGREPWDLRNRYGRLVASGVYFWHVVTPEGQERVGKFTIVNPHRDPFGTVRR